MSNQSTDSVRRYMVARAVTPTPTSPLVLLIQPGGRIVMTNNAARQLAGRDDVAWIFWDRVLASADDAHRVRESIRASFRAPGAPQTCAAQMHGSSELSFRCTALSADSALLVAHAPELPPDSRDDLTGDDLFERSSLTSFDSEHSLLDRVAVDQRMNLLRSVVAIDRELHAGPFQSAPGASSFFLAMRETSVHGQPALAVRPVSA